MNAETGPLALQQRLLLSSAMPLSSLVCISVTLSSVSALQYSVRCYSVRCKKLPPQLYRLPHKGTANLCEALEMTACS